MFLRQAGVRVLFRQACGDTHSFFFFFSCSAVSAKAFSASRTPSFRGGAVFSGSTTRRAIARSKSSQTAMLANYYRGRDSSSRRRVPLSDVPRYGAIHLESCSCTLATLPLWDPELDPLNPPPPCLYCKVKWCGGRGFLRRDSKATCIGSRR